MKKFMSDIKNNKYTMIAIGLFIVMLLLAFGLYKFLFPNIGSPIYGNRLAGIEEVTITDEQKTELTKKLEEKNIFKKITYNLRGKTFNIIITVAEDAKASDAKKLTETIMEVITEKQHKYFDIQVFIKNENEEKEGYPIIGYLNKESDTFSYSAAK